MTQRRTAVRRVVASPSRFAYHKMIRLLPNQGLVGSQSLKHIKKKNGQRQRLRQNSLGVQNTVHNPLKVICGVTRRDFQATVSFTPEISDGIENVLAENQANCKQHTCSLTNPL